MAYTQITFVPVGHQPGRQRYNLHGGDTPIIKSWRCDLTAFSQVYNYYFVACDDIIRVHRPSFPDQWLGNTVGKDPIREIIVPASNTPVPFGIDPQNPHSITRLLVGYLGNFEVLMAACDDGDVATFRISDIHRVIQEDERRLELALVSVDWDYEDAEIKCFDHRNVGASAWGLAIHREARLLAFSANTHQIRVVAYGLSTPKDQSNSTDYEYAFSRNKDRDIILHTQSNIPWVSFDNSGGDRKGKWLSGSTIDGRVYLWDLSKPEQPARIISIGYCASAAIQPPQVPRQCDCSNRSFVPHAVWATLFIDPNSCHMSDSLNEACGLALDAEKLGQLAPGFLDISFQREPSSVSARSSRDKDLASEDTDTAVHSNTDNEDSLFVSPAPVETIDVSADEEDDNEDGSAVLEGPPGHPANTVPIDNDDEDDDSDAMSEAWEVHPRDLLPPKPKKFFCSYVTASALRDTPPSHLPNHPMLIITKDEIYLLQSPISSMTPSTIFTMRNPLYPSTTDSATSWNESSAHRQCFASQIPELGVFIVATPTGRVGVFRLTRAWHQKKMLYAFRLEWVFDKHHGAARLVGVAVAPVQGMGDKEEDAESDGNGDGAGAGTGVGGHGERPRERPRRRWRMLVYWTDHSVDSYELCKFGEGGANDMVGVEELMV